MPALGMAQETGKLLAWFKQEGDVVAKGEPLMEIETDKVTVSIDATESGVLANIIATAGQDVPVGHAIALILAEGEKAPPREEFLAALKAASAPAAAPAAAPRPVAARPAAQLAAPQPTPAYAPAGAVVVNASAIAMRIAAEHGVDLALVRPSGGRISKEDVREYIRTRGVAPAGGFVPARSAGSKVLASPKAKRIAQEMGVDLALLRGSDPEGAVLAIDVTHAGQGAAPAAPALPQVAQGPPLSSLWKVMAEHVTESWQDIPHFVLSREVDATNIMAARKTAQAKSEAKITFTDLLVKFCAEALVQHPNVNATWRSRTIWPNEHINVGLAVGVEDGLVVPVVADADKLSLQDVAVRRAELVQKANSKSLLPADIQGGTFTISNLGMYAIDSFTAIVNAPNAAILAVGRIVERVVPVDGQPAIRPMLALTLSCDHRVLDGLRGAQFLDTLASLIEAAEIKE